MKLFNFRPKTFSNRVFQNHLSATNTDQPPHRKLTPLESIMKTQTSWEKFPPAERIHSLFDSQQESINHTRPKAYQQQTLEIKENPNNQTNPENQLNQLVQRQMSLQRRIAYIAKKLARKQNIRQHKIQRIKARSGHIIGIASTIALLIVGLYLAPIAFVATAMVYVCGRFFVGEFVGNLYEALSNEAFEKEIAGQASTLKTLKEFLSSIESEIENLDHSNETRLLTVLPFTKNALWLESPISQFLPELSSQTEKEKGNES